MEQMIGRVGREMHWKQPSARKMEYQLLDGEECIAALRFRNSFGSFATAECAEGIWTFKRVGFWHPHVTVRKAEMESDLAIYRNHTWSSGGTLAFPDGRAYRASTNFWATQYAIETLDGQKLVSYASIGGMLHLSSKMVLHPAAASLAELPWLAVFGWYLAILMLMDSATTAAVAA